MASATARIFEMRKLVRRDHGVFARRTHLYRFRVTGTSNNAKNNPKRFTDTSFRPRHRRLLLRAGFIPIARPMPATVNHDSAALLQCRQLLAHHRGQPGS
jgi:hypothetical protein